MAKTNPAVFGQKQWSWFGPFLRVSASVATLAQALLVGALSPTSVLPQVDRPRWKCVSCIAILLKRAFLEFISLGCHSWKVLCCVFVQAGVWGIAGQGLPHGPSCRAGLCRPSRKKSNRSLRQAPCGGKQAMDVHRQCGGEWALCSGSVLVFGIGAPVEEGLLGHW